MKEKTLVIITGPTGVGKTRISIEVAKYFNAEIFSCDSRQFYRQLNIGVAKPETEELESVKHNFIGHIDVTEHYSISKFEEDAISSLSKYFKVNDTAIMTGGSGLYIDAVTKGVSIMPDYDPEVRDSLMLKYKNEGIESLRFDLKRIDPNYYEQVDLQNPQRILRALEVFYSSGKTFSELRKPKSVNRDFKILKIGITSEREKLYNSINNRVDEMLEKGLVEEAKNLYKYKNHIALKTIGYKELFMYFEGSYDLDKAIELIKRNSRRYARRQMTWFKRYEDIKWFENNEEKEILSYISSKL